MLFRLASSNVAQVPDIFAKRAGIVVIVIGMWKRNPIENLLMGLTELSTEVLRKNNGYYKL